MTQTIEEAMTNITAEHDLYDMTIGRRTYGGDRPYCVSLLWKDKNDTTGLACALGEGATLDDALAAAIERMTEKR